MPAQYLSTSPFRDQAAIDFLAAQVTNPFCRLLPKTSMNNPTIARSQLLRPYPQYSGLSTNENIGYSWYHSMQVRLEKRFSQGLNASMSYTWSKNDGSARIPESHRYRDWKKSSPARTARIVWR